jgi:hypothetical protein
MPRKLHTLSAPKSASDKSKPKSKKIGFKGGLKKLQNIRNDIAVSEKKGLLTKGVSKIGRTKKSIPVTGVRQKKVILHDPVLTKEEEQPEEEDSSELVTEDSENEDMTRFCKRMCKKSIESMSESANGEEIAKAKEMKKFQKIREKFISTILTDFRSKVKTNIKAGKFILYQYDTLALHEQYTISDLLNKLDDNTSTDDTNQTGLRIMADMISPFRLIHYVHRVEQKPAKELRVIEVTWASPSKKSTKLAPNKLPEKYNKRWNITAHLPPILQATTIAPEPKAPKQLRTLDTSVKHVKKGLDDDNSEESSI